MLRVGTWLNLAALVCLIGGLFAGYQTYERELGRAHGAMRARFNACAGGVYETHAFEDHRLQLLMTSCAESLDDDRWLPVLAPNLSRDTVVASAGPFTLALALSLLPFLVGRGLPVRSQKSRATIVS
jgi:hypothetical protein